MTKTAKAEATGYLIAREATAGTAPGSGWVRLEPNPGGIQGHEPKIIDVNRDPLSKFATDEEGSPVGIDAQPTLVHDLNKDLADVFAEGWTRSLAKVPGDEPTTAIYRPTAFVDGGGGNDSMTVAADGDIANGILVRTRGARNSANNGVFKLAGGSTTLAIKVATATFVAETISPTGSVTAEVCGVELAADDGQIDSNGDFICTTLDATTLGLVDGHEIKIGDDAVGTRFATCPNGWATVDGTVTAGKIPLKWHSFTPVADTGSGKTIRLFFGRCYRNVATDHADYVEPSWHAEKEDLGVGTAEAAVYTYLKGIGLNRATFAVPVRNKIVVTQLFEGMDIANPVLVASRVSGPSSAYPTVAPELFDTATDLVECKVYDSADASLIADVNSFTLTLDHAADPQHQLGTEGAAAINYGKVRPRGQMEVYYRSFSVPVGIRANTTYRQTTRLKNNSGGISIHLPKIKLRGGAMSYAANKPVMVDVELPAFRDTLNNQVLVINVLPYIPAT